MYQGSAGARPPGFAVPPIRTCLEGRQATAFLRKDSILKEDESLEQPAALLHVADAMARLLEETLETSGYGTVDDGRPLSEGEVRFVKGHMEVFFKKAV